MVSERKWTGKSKGNKAGHQIFVFLIKHAGIKAAYALLIFISFYFFTCKWKINKYIYQYFRTLGFGKFKSFLSVYKNYFVFGQTLIDRIYVMACLNSKFDFYFEGETYLNDMIHEQKGGILLSAHTGNWEIAGHFLDRLNIPIHILMVDDEYQKLKDYLENITGKRKANIITIKEDQSHLYQILEAINKKEIVCIHADRLLNSKQKCISLPLLHKEANFPYSIFKMIVTLNVPVSFVFAHKEKGFKYHFYATEARLYKSSNDEQDVIRLAKDYVNELERRLYQYPLQWFNYYDFWERNTA